MDLIAEAKEMVAKGRGDKGWLLIGKSQEGVQIIRNAINDVDLSYGIFELARHDKGSRDAIIAAAALLKFEENENEGN